MISRTHERVEYAELPTRVVCELHSPYDEQVDDRRGSLPEIFSRSYLTSCNDVRAVLLAQ